MAKKVLIFRGKTLEELKEMGLTEFMDLVPSSSRRSLKRGFTSAQQTFLKKLKTAKKPLKTHCRDLVIIPEMLEKKILVYSGKEWVAVEIDVEMLGKKLGEFSLTRKKVAHSAPGVGATRSSKHLSVR